MTFKATQIALAIAWVLASGTSPVGAQNWDDYDDWDDYSDESKSSKKKEQTPDENGDSFWPDDVELEDEKPKEPKAPKKIKSKKKKKKKPVVKKAEDTEEDEPIEEEEESSKDDEGPSEDKKNDANKHTFAYSIKTIAEIGFERSTSQKPSPTISLAPDFWITPLGFLDLGWVHSTWGKNGIWVGRNDSLCFTLEERDCPRVYDSSSLRALFKIVKTTHSTIKIDASAFMQSLSPFSFGVRLGVLWNLDFGKNSITINPSTTFSIFQRDGKLFPIPLENNENDILLPISLIHHLSPSFYAGVQFAAIQNVAVLQLGQFSPDAFFNFRGGYNISEKLSLEAMLGIDTDCTECFGLNFGISYNG